MPSPTARQAQLERETPLDQRIAVNLDGACVLTGLSRTKVQSAVIKGRLKSLKVGRTRLIEVASLREFITAATKTPVDKEGTPLVKRARRAA